MCARYICVRPVTALDKEPLSKMPPYSRSMADDFSCSEDILVADSNGLVYGAVSVSRKEVSCVSGEWRNDFDQHLPSLTKVVGGWISKLFVLPEYRHKGIGTRLVEEAIEHARKKEFAEAYAGIYVKNMCRIFSLHIFVKLGFKQVGSCICFLTNGQCRGLLLEKELSR